MAALFGKVKQIEMIVFQLFHSLGGSDNSWFVCLN